MALDASYLEAKVGKLERRVEDLKTVNHALTNLKDPRQKRIPWDAAKAKLRENDLRREIDYLERQNLMLARRLRELENV